MQSSSEILQAPLAVFDTADDEDTIQSSDSGGWILFLTTLWIILELPSGVTAPIKA